jgi:hypothetical protein
LYADLRRLIPVSTQAKGATARHRARLLRLTPRAIDAQAGQRAALFSVTEAQEDLGFTYRTLSFAAPYRALWYSTTRRHQEETILEGHTDSVLALCTLPGRDGQTVLASAGYDGTVRLWNPYDGSEVTVLEGHTSAVNALCTVSGPDGRTLLASAGYDGTVRLWDPHDDWSSTEIPVRLEAHCLASTPKAVFVALRGGLLGFTTDPIHSTRGAVRDD